jgi:hypothetical protein
MSFTNRKKKQWFFERIGEGIPMRLDNFQVRRKLYGHYKDVTLAMHSIKEGERLRTPFEEIYWEKVQ